MKLFFILVFFLSVFISTGYCLSCISCTGTKALCTGSSVTCNGTNEVCTTIYTETILEAYGLTTYSLVRGCGQSSECNQPKTLSNQFMTVNVNTGCCSTNDCNTTEPTVATSNSVNGLVCPSCFTLTAATCVSDSEIRCTGNETRCTTYSMSTTTVPSKPILGMAGCATENLCSNFNGVTSTSTTGQIRINITCGNATVSPTTSRPFISTSSPVKNNATNVISESTKSAVVTSTGNIGSTTRSIVLTSAPHNTSESLGTGPQSTDASLNTGFHRTTESVGTQITTKITEATRHSDVVSPSHSTKDIANPVTTNATATHFTTRITFTPTDFHSSTHNIAASTTCVCNGCTAHYSVFSLSSVVIITLIKFLH